MERKFIQTEEKMNIWCPICGRKIQISHTHCCECEEMGAFWGLKIKPGEKFPYFILRVYETRVDLNIPSPIPIDFKIDYEKGIARYYFKRRKE